jgi:hypothetical protein
MFKSPTTTVRCARPPLRHLDNRAKGSSRKVWLSSELQSPLKWATKRRNSGQPGKRMTTGVVA